MQGHWNSGRMSIPRAVSDTDRRHALHKIFQRFAIRNTVDQRNDKREPGILTGRGSRVASRQHAVLWFFREPYLEEVRKTYEYHTRAQSGRNDRPG